MGRGGRGYKSEDKELFQGGRKAEEQSRSSPSIRTSPWCREQRSPCVSRRSICCRRRRGCVQSYLCHTLQLLRGSPRLRILRGNPRSLITDLALIRPGHQGKQGHPPEEDRLGVVDIDGRVNVVLDVDRVAFLVTCQNWTSQLQRQPDVRTTKASSLEVWRQGVYAGGVGSDPECLTQSASNVCSTRRTTQVCSVFHEFEIHGASKAWKDEAIKWRPSALCGSQPEISGLGMAPS